MTSLDDFQFGAPRDRPRSRVECEQRVLRACATIRATVRSDKPGALRSSMAAYVYDDADRRAQAGARRGVKAPWSPEPRDLEDADNAMSWLEGLGRDRRLIIELRSFVVDRGKAKPWRAIADEVAKKVGTKKSHTAMVYFYNEAIDFAFDRAIQKK